MSRLHVIMVKQMSKGMEKYQFEKFQDALFLTMESNGCESFLATMESEAKGFILLLIAGSSVGILLIGFVVK